LVCMPASRAISEATAPGSSAAATIRSFSSRDQRRRRCTDVITSTCVLVMVLVLGLLLGLHAKPIIEGLGDVRADLAQSSSALRTAACSRVHDLFAWQVFG